MYEISYVFRIYIGITHIIQTTCTYLYFAARAQQFNSLRINACSRVYYMLVYYRYTACIRFWFLPFLHELVRFTTVCVIVITILLLNYLVHNDHKKKKTLKQTRLGKQISTETRPGQGIRPSVTQPCVYPATRVKCLRTQYAMCVYDVFFTSTTLCPLQITPSLVYSRHEFLDFFLIRA